MTTTSPSNAVPAAGSGSGPGSGDADALVLVPPAPVAAVSPERARSAVPVEPDVARELDARAGQFARGLADLDVASPRFAARVASIDALGDREIRDSASVSSRLLDTPGRAMAAAGGPGAEVAGSLAELRRVVEDLDPSGRDLFSPRKLLGRIPFGDKLHDYFAAYASSQSHLNAIVTALYRGQDELRKDNASIEQEKQNLWSAMDRLRRYAYLAERVDVELSARIAEMELTDPDRARTLRGDALFAVRRKYQDLLTQLAVNAQGHLALDLVRRNNLELIKGVDRATTATVAALRTAIIAAEALADQRLVLDQIAALNRAAGTVVESTPRLLRQAGRAHEQAAGATASLDALRNAFADIYATIDAIDAYTLAAADTMKSTVDALSVEIGKARGYLRQAAGDWSGGPAAAQPADSALTLPAERAGS